MIKTTLKIEGMACPMCESHMNDTIRKIYPDCKVSSSHKKAETVVISEAALDEAKVRKAVADTGYEYKGMRSEPYEKKGFFAKLFG